MFSLKIFLKLSFLFLWCSVLRGELVVDVKDVDSLGVDLIQKEGTLVETVIRETGCEGVRDKVDIYEFFINNNGKIEHDTAELVVRMIDNKDQQFYTELGESTITLRADLNCLSTDDPVLVKTLLSDILRPPSTGRYNPDMISADTDKSYSETAQDVFLDTVVFKEELKDGFFVEAGADEFVDGSNTLRFELKHNWTGVLVEPNPMRFPKGYLANRKAWAAPICLAIKDKPHYSPFANAAAEGLMFGLIPKHVEEDRLAGNSFDLQCFPLYSILLAVGNPTVNYFSLDIEGAEYLVLQHLPWDKVDIEVLGIELVHAGLVFPGTRDEVHGFVDERGYDYVGTVGKDDIFVRKDLSQGKYKVDQEEARKFNYFYFDETIKNGKKEEL